VIGASVLLVSYFSVIGGRNVEFSFSTLGRLTIRNRKVKMKFYKEFINSLEGANEILRAMQNVSPVII